MKASRLILALPMFRLLAIKCIISLLNSHLKARFSVLKLLMNFIPTGSLSTKCCFYFSWDLINLI